MTGFENLTLPLLPSLARCGWLPAGAERAHAAAAFKRLNVPAPNVATATVGLSGGNQQKIVLAKWLAARCRLLILDEPTRGVDVGAKAEIHALIDDLAESGTAVLLDLQRAPRADRAVVADAGVARGAPLRRASARRRSRIADAPDGGNPGHAGRWHGCCFQLADLTKRPHFLGILHAPGAQSFRMISYGFPRS